MADETDSKSVAGNRVWVQVPPPAPNALFFGKGRFFVFRLREKYNAVKIEKKEPFESLQTATFAVACLEGFEPPTYWFVASHSIRLSYRHIVSHNMIYYITNKSLCQAFLSKKSDFFEFVGIARNFGIFPIENFYGMLNY